MGLSDQSLLENVMSRQEYAWEAFVDRYLCLVAHVVNHLCETQSLSLSPRQKEELIRLVFQTITDQDFHLLKTFRQKSNFSSFLTILARRIIIKAIQQQSRNESLTQVIDNE